jgi:uncharacterized protein (DUF305 family)
MMPFSAAGTVASLLAIALTACRGTTRGGDPSPATATVTTQSDALYTAQARADSVRHPYTTADIQFMSRMIGHHSQAIVISRWAPTHGASAAILTLAARIINGQQDEIATMQRWLRDRLQPVPDAKDSGMKMMMDGVEHTMPMPGMLSDAELRRLDAARGPEFDRLFLSLMIRHHRGAVAMVKDLFGSYGAAQDETVFRLASDVNVDQSTEIDRMVKMLAALPLQSR